MTYLRNVSGGYSYQSSWTGTGSRKRKEKENEKFWPHRCWQDRVPELHSGSEGLMLCDGEHQQEALPAAKIVVPDGSVVLLAGCVQNVDLDLLPVQNHLLPVAVCLGGFVVLYKLG